MKAVALESCLGWKWNNRKRCRDLLNELRGREVGSHRVINIVSTRLGLDPALTCQAYGAFLVGRSGEFSQCTGSLSYIVESYELYAAAFHAVLRGGLGVICGSLFIVQHCFHGAYLLAFRSLLLQNSLRVYSESHERDTFSKLALNP